MPAPLGFMFNAAAVEPTAPMGAVPAGTYNVQIEDAKVIPVKSDASQSQYELTFVIIDGKRCAISGDAARLEADASITVFGRDSQCINTGGEKVFTEEVEEGLRSYPGVRDAVVVGIPDPRWGQRVVALVSLRRDVAEDAATLKQHCRARLAGYKVPKDVLFVAEVARNPMGKADYRWARQVAEQRLGSKPDS